MDRIRSIIAYLSYQIYEEIIKLNNSVGSVNMKQFYITELKIKSVRHLKNITIPLSKEGIKHLILTGKNGMNLSCSKIVSFRI